MSTEFLEIDGTPKNLTVAATGWTGLAEETTYNVQNVGESPIQYVEAAASPDTSGPSHLYARKAHFPVKPTGDGVWVWTSTGKSSLIAATEAD